MLTVRWVVTALLGLLWLLITVVNASLAWRAWVRKEERVPSLVPLVGGFVAYFAVRLSPLDEPYQWLYFLLAILLDVGSLPYLAAGLIGYLTRDRDT